MKAFVLVLLVGGAVLVNAHRAAPRDAAGVVATTEVGRVTATPAQLADASAP